MRTYHADIPITLAIDSPNNSSRSESEILMIAKIEMTAPIRAVSIVCTNVEQMPSGAKCGNNLYNVLQKGTSFVSTMAGTT